MSNQKRSFICDMGVWDRETWRWTFCWRRNFLLWEQDLFQQLLDCLPQSPFMDGEEDAYIWKFGNNGVFSIISSILQVQRFILNNNLASSVISKAWLGIVPPHAKILVWFVLQERLNTRERLCKLAILQPIEAICPFCNQEVESVTHVFYTCYVSWNIWADILNWWGFA